MSKYLNFQITDSGPLSKEVSERGFSDFHAFAEYIRCLPYGRAIDSVDILSVLREKRGTCSGKHRLLAAVAHECGHHEVRLMIGIYGM